MPIYQRNGKTYNIPDSEVEGFEKTYPDATQKYAANGRNYNIPVSERDGFLSTYKDATPFAFNTNDNIELKSHAIEQKPIEQKKGSIRDYKPIIQKREHENFNIKEAMDGPTDSERREQERKRIEEQTRLTKDRNEKEFRNAKDNKAKADYEAIANSPFSFISEVLFGTQTPKQIETQKKAELSRASLEKTNNAFNMIEEASRKGNTTYISGFGRGFLEKISKVNTLDFGAMDSQTNLNILSAAKKYESGQLLSSEEETLLDAVALEAAASGEFSGDLGRGYKAGSTVAESLPFMAEFMINPATGTGKVVGKAAAKKIISNFGKEAARSTIGKIARNSARVAGDIAGAGIMTGTTGAMRTAADAVDRATGDVKPIVDSDGYYRFGGTEEGDGTMEAFSKAYGASTIENFSEMFGNYLAPIGSVIGAGAGKAMTKIGLGKVNKIIGDIRSSDVAKALDNFQSKTQWNGTIGEYLEEQAGMAMNALTVGDNKLSDMVDPNVQIDTFLGVSALGGLFSSVKTTGYAREKYLAKKKLNEANRFAASQDVIGEQEWNDMRGRIDQADDSELVSILSETMANENIGDEGKQAALVYAGRLKAYHGASLADLKRKTEGDTPDEVVQSQINFDEGYRLAEADRKEKRHALKRMDEIGKKLDEEFISVDDNGRYDLVRQRADAGEDVSNELNYINSLSRFNGMIMGIRDAIDEKVSRSNQYITNMAHQDGNIYDVTLTADEKKHVFPISGLIVVDENGFIDRKQSDTRFIVRDDTGKIEMRSVDDLYKLESSGNADTLKEVTAQSIRDQESARHAEEIESPSEEEKAEEVASVQPGDIISLDMQGVRATATVQSKRDGATVLLFDEPIEYNGKKSQTIELSDEQVQSMIIPAEENGSNMIDSVGKNDGYIPIEESKLTDIPMGDTIKQEEESVENIESETSAQDDSVPAVSIPVDEKGSLLYHKAPVELTIADLNDGNLTTDEVDAFVSANKEEATKQLKKISEKPPKIGTNKTKYLEEKKKWTDAVSDINSQVSYWNEVEAQLQATREQPGDATAGEIMAMGDPLNGEELAAMMLGTGKLPLLQKDYMRETGYGRNEVSGMFGGRQNTMFRSEENGGMTVEQAGEQLMLADMEAGTNFFDQNDPNAGRNAILDMLSSASTRGDLVNYVRKNREAMAEREKQAEYEAYESWCNETFHMTPEEYEAYEENSISLIEEKYKGFDEEEFYGNIADELKQRENDTQREITGTIESDAVLQREEFISSGRTGSSEGGQGSAVQASLQGGNENGIISESTSRREIDEIVSRMQDAAEVAPVLELTPENWSEEFGDDGIINTPIGDVKMGGNQYLKLLKNKRENQFGMIRPTLVNPDVVIEQFDPKEDVERESEYLFVKCFVDEYGGKHINFESVTVSKGGKEIVISNHIIRGKQLRKKIEEGKLLWNRFEVDSNSSGENQDLSSPATVDPNNMEPVSNYQSNLLSSVSKDNEESENKQANDEFIAPAHTEGESIFAYAERVNGAHLLHQEEKNVDTNPTEAQKEAGNYRKGHIKIDGFDITIENPKGSERSGVDTDGKPWSVTINNTYGYIRGTEGVDGDHIDVFLGNSGNGVYVVDQVKEDGSFDEHKVMYGFGSMDEAKEAYLSNYSPGWKGLGGITEVSKTVFKEWVDSSHRKTKPFSEYKIVQDSNSVSAMAEYNLMEPKSAYEAGERGKRRENENIFDFAERIVEEERINKNYDNALSVVNEFSEKCAGACRALVIKSNELLRKQMEAVDIELEDIDKYERWAKDGDIIAFYTPKYNRIVVLDTNYSKEELNAYLWHENAHKALKNVFGSDMQNTIDKVYDLFYSSFSEKFDSVKGYYSERPHTEQREECVAWMMEDLYKSFGFKMDHEFINRLKNEEARNILSRIFNNIIHGQGFESQDGESLSGRYRRKDDGGIREKYGRESKTYGSEAEGREAMEVRDDDGNSGFEKESGRIWNDLRSVFEAGEERLRRKDKSQSASSGVGEQSSQESEDVARQEYEMSLDKTKNKMYRWQEAYQDSMLALKKLQDAIVKESEIKLQHFEDAYMAENQMSSKSAFETEVYKDKYLIPMLNAIKRITDRGISRDKVNIYVMAKHGLERNAVFAKRDAEKDANEKFDEKISDVHKSLDKGDISHDEWEEKMDDLNAQKKDFYEEQYIKNRMRDYSGLTQLAKKENEEEEDYEAVAKGIVDQFEKSFDTKELWEKINLATKQTLKKSYGSGLMTRGTYEKVKNMFEFYVPLRGWNDDVASDVYEYMLSERSVFQAPVKVALGRKSLADDPFANIGNMAESGILQGNRNLMKQKFLNMVLNHPTSLATVKTMWYERTMNGDKEEWKESFPKIDKDYTADEIAQAIEDHEAKMIDLEKNRMATKSTNKIKLEYRSSARENNEHTVVVKNGGKEYVIYVNGNPRAAQAINGLTNPDASNHRLVKGTQWLNRQLAANFTTRNPAFVLSNMSRDVIFSTSAIWIKENWKYAKRFDKNIIKNIGAIAGMMTRYKSGKLDMRNSRDRHFLEFLENGGETGYTALHNVDEYKKMMNRHIKKSDGTIGSLSSGAHAIVDAVSFMNRCAENVSRFTTYQTSREMGRGISESVRDAKEVTVNFNKKGSGGLGAGTFKSLFLFFNAAVQSLSNFKGLHGKSKSKFYTAIGGFAAAGVLMPMINNAIIEMLIGDDDDEMTDEDRAEWIKKKGAYDNLPEWVRRNNFCIWVGGERFVTIPLPIELRAFYGLGEMWYQMGRGNMNGFDGKVDVKKASIEMVNQLTELLPINPLGGNGDALSIIVPDAGKPLYQVFANRDFFGKPIYKDGNYNERMPAWTKAYNGTAKWMVNSTEFINEVSGGDKYMQGEVDLNPATIEHVFEGYLGGMGKTANQLYKTLSMIWDKDERMWRNVPVANRFISGKDNKIEFRKVNEAYYQYMDELKETEQRLRGYENEAEMGIEEYAKKYDFLNESKENERYLIMKEYKSVIDDMRKVIKESDPEEKKEIEMEVNLLKIEMIDELKNIR